MPWKPGQSGNPGGRSKSLKCIHEAAQKHGLDAIAALARIVKNGETDAVKVSAAVALLDRGYGKPAQTVNANVTRTVFDLTEADLVAIATGRSTLHAGAERRESEPDQLH